MPFTGQYIPRRTMGVVNGPFSSDEDTTLGGGGVSFGADAEIARQQRALALQGLTDALAAAKQRSMETPDLAAQRANIAAHGTIETPNDFKLRMGRENAAELTDPATAFGKLGMLEQQRKLDQAYEQNVRPAEIGAEAKKYDTDAATAAEANKSADALAGSLYQSDQGLQTGLEKDLAPYYDPDAITKYGGEAQRDAAVKAFLAAVMQARAQAGAR